MGDILNLIWRAVVGLFRSRASLEAEILTLRHQLNVCDEKYRSGSPGVVNALVIVKPETVIGWHRAGFRSFW